ncbi:hypothetical protein UFOVP11_22 [uncultured Caudovirales phage]|uniref:Uncharacterized protein n=1 Tax=uncultured Caudovirales phage TaxID=2100421 RepID=A0A6J5KMI3_9CAUD|nr:hypothetical protein UFOVP11_22 [uncultured Caudovirales phage]
MTAHGTDPATVDQETFTDICVMFNDGIIGNLGIIQVIGTLTAGQFNTVLPKGATAFKLQDIIPTQYEYLYPPLSEEAKREAINQSLMAFAQMHPNAPSHIFKE